MSTSESGLVPSVSSVADVSSIISKPRLVIKNIEVDNFKSYAGQHTIGPFHKTFTAVIGPNGSGKSNVIDAMLFVFGKNAKKIRLEKLSELIHVSAAHPNLTRASVAVNFVQIRETEEDKKDPTQRLEVPNSGLSVMREVFKNNVSQYYINGQKRTQREVVETLTGHGIDLDHNRFLILQGEVQQIALMKPKAEKEGEEGLVEYFDDLIGSNQFLPSIKEATRLVEEQQELRLTSLDALRKVQGERDALSSAKDSTLSFIRKDNHLQKMVTVLLQLKLEGIEDSLKEPRQKVAALEESIKSMEERRVKREAELTEQSTKDNELKKAIAELRSEGETLRKDKSKTEIEAEKLKTSNEEFEKARKKEMDKLKKLKDEVTKLEMDINHNENCQKIAEGNLTEAAENVVKLQARYDTKAAEVQAIQMPIRQRLEGLRKEIAPLDEVAAKAVQAEADIKYKLSTIAEAEEKAGEELARFQEERQNKTVIAGQIEEALRRADESSPELDAAIAALEERQMKTMKLKYHLNAQIDNVKKEFLAAESGDNVSRILATKSLPKYYGSLRQLGRIGDEYDVAAGVASGMWDYHVVEDNETAVEVVNVLKREGLRCTMMVLEKIEKIHGAAMARDYKPPAGSQRIFDLIQPVKPKFRIAFYNAVRDTLVVNSIDVARKVAWGDKNNRNRVATTRGELLERNGGFSGGGLTPPGAKLKATHAAPDKEATKRKLMEWQKELVGLVDEENSIVAELQRLNSQRPDTSPQELRRMRTELAGLKSSITALAGRIESTKERLKEAQREGEKRASLEGKLEMAREASQKANAARQTLLTKIRAAEAELGEVAGVEYKELAAELQRNKRIVEVSEVSIKEHKRIGQKARVTKEARQKEVERITAEMAKQQSDAHEADKAQAAKLVAAIEELSGKIRVVAARVSELEGQQLEVDNAMKETTRRISNITKEIDSLCREKMEEESKMKEQLEVIAKIQTRIADCRKRVIDYVMEFGVATLRTHDVESGRGRGGARKRERAIASQAASSEDGSEDPDGDELGAESSSQATDLASNPSQLARDEDEEDEELDDDDAFDAENYHLTVTPEQLKTYDAARVSVMTRDLSTECNRLQGTINFEAVQIWRNKQAEYKAKKADYEGVVARLNKAEADLDDLTERRKDLFMENFKIIQRKLKEMYQLLAQGGDADVDLVNSADPYEGIAFTVRPPKKSWKQVGNLSGGEQTLSSLALVFALHHIKPTPIYVMDEIDAALDFRNVSIVGRYVLEQAQGAQFIIISLRNNMFELAHQLVGICKVNDVTRSLTINPLEVSRRIARQLERIVAVQNGTRNAQPMLEQRHNRGSAAAGGSPANDGGGRAAAALDEDDVTESRTTRGHRAE